MPSMSDADGNLLGSSQSITVTVVTLRNSTKILQGTSEVAREAQEHLS